MSGYVEELTVGADLYVPGSAVNDALHDVTLVPIVAPTAVGKSTCIQYVIDHWPETSRADRCRSFTTRPHRDDEPEDQYRYFPHDETSLAYIANQARRNRLVQYAVHPSTGFIYGSEIGDYTAPYMLIDALSSAVTALRLLPVRSLFEISLVCEPDVWLERFRSRQSHPADARKRLTEGISSLEWSLGQSVMAWVDNSGEVAVTGAEIIGIVSNNHSPDPSNRKIGERLLATMRNMHDN